jgi:dihydropyrimidinase
VWADGKLDVERGAGRYIEKPPFASYYDAMQKQAERKRPQPVRRLVDSSRVRQSR